MPPFLHRGSPNQTVFGVPALPTNESNKTDRRFLVALSVAVTKNEVCPNAEVSRIQATTSFSIGNFLLLQNTAADLKRFSRRRNENFSFKVGRTVFTARGEATLLLRRRSTWDSLPLFHIAGEHCPLLGWKNDGNIIKLRGTERDRSKAIVRKGCP